MGSGIGELSPGAQAFVDGVEVGLREMKEREGFEYELQSIIAEARRRQGPDETLAFEVGVEACRSVTRPSIDLTPEYQYKFDHLRMAQTERLPERLVDASGTKQTDIKENNDWTRVL